MDRGAVQTREIFQLANEAELEGCIPQPVSMSVGLLVQFQERAARLAAEGCNDRIRRSGQMPLRSRTWHCPR